MARLLGEWHNAKARIEATTERRQALPSADYVITAVARDRMLLCEQDFYIPTSYGFRNVCGECGGPGAAFHTLCSIQDKLIKIGAKVFRHAR